MPNRLVVLIVDDHPDLLITLSSFVERLPYVRVLSTGDFGRVATWIAAEKCIDLVLTNVWLKGDFNGLHVADLAAAAHPEVAIVMISTDERSNIQGLPGHHAFIQMPFGVEALIEHVDDAFVRRHKS